MKDIIFIIFIIFLIIALLFAIVALISIIKSSKRQKELDKLLRERYKMQIEELKLRVENENLIKSEPKKRGRKKKEEK